MIRLMIILLITALWACEGKLSDEQRKEMKRQMELHKIKRVTDAEITEAAFARGRAIMKSLESIKDDSVRIDSLVKAHQGRVKWLVPGEGNAAELEQQLIDAYMANETGAPRDNIQKVRNSEGTSDSILYSKPVLIKMSDGSEKLEGVWNIWLSRKELILSMDK